MANGNRPSRGQRSRLPMTSWFPALLPWGCGEAGTTSGHHLPGGIPGPLPERLAGLPPLPWRRTGAGITAGRHTLCHIPSGDQRRTARPLLMITVQVRAKPASHAHLTSFGLSEVRTSGTGPRRTYQGRLSHEGAERQRHSIKGITLARGQTQTRGDRAGTQRARPVSSVWERGNSGEA